MIDCILCRSKAIPFFVGRHGEYYRCPNCLGVFLSPAYFLSADAERARYETHNNDITDPGYQVFVAPIVDSIRSAPSREQRGLDFGCGTGPVIQYLLEQHGFSLDLYDPYFHNDRSVFSKQYDYIACCEVTEHFHDPGREFALLFTLLKPGGRLYCMTHLLNDEIEFSDWYYKEDPTHVFFYSPGTFEFIEREFGFSGHFIKDRLVVITK